MKGSQLDVNILKPAIPLVTIQTLDIARMDASTDLDNSLLFRAVIGYWLLIYI